MEKMNQLMDAFCNHVPDYELKSLSHNTDYYCLIDIAYESVMNHNGNIDYDTFFDKVKEKYGKTDEYIQSIGLRNSLENLVRTLSYLKRKKKLK
ncbi:hypothetical protein AB9N12_07870 [Bacteroides sp. AN502(2024)]|uniref:hypothetical protein n=1 Tax=Bacteroides sp. AN502(2024) TaxID=3160599 RepID=UPI0035120C37